LFWKKGQSTGYTLHKDRIFAAKKKPLPKTHLSIQKFVSWNPFEAKKIPIMFWPGGKIAAF